MLTLKIPASIYILFLLLVLIFGVKKAKKGEFHENFLSLDIAKGLQGFAAIGIMLHHLAQNITNFGAVRKGLITSFNSFGVIFTAIFFFFSGYGLYTSLQEKTNYLEHFFRKRLSTVLVPFYMANTIFVLFSLPNLPKSTPLELIAYFTGWIMLNNNLWYVVEITFLYIAFYLIFKYIKNRKAALLSMAAFLFVMIALTLFNGHDYDTISQGAWFKGEWWYNTTWTFFLGMLVSRFKEPLLRFIKKYYLLFLSCGIVLSVVLLPFSNRIMGEYGYYCEYEGHPGYFEKLVSALAQGSYAIIAAVTLLLITMKLQFKNKALAFLGKISIELYLIHRLYIVLFEDMIKNDALFFLCVYAAAIPTAALLHFIDGKIIKLIKGSTATVKV